MTRTYKGFELKLFAGGAYDVYKDGSFLCYADNEEEAKLFCDEYIFRHRISEDELAQGDVYTSIKNGKSIFDTLADTGREHNAQLLESGIEVGKASLEKVLSDLKAQVAIRDEVIKQLCVVLRVAEKRMPEGQLKEMTNEILRLAE